MLQRSRVILVSLTVVLAAVACSDGGDEDAAPTPTSAPTTAPGSASVTGPAAEFCERTRDLGEGDDIGQIDPAIADPQQLEDELARASEEIQQVEAVAPEDVKADVTVVAAAFEEFRTALEQADYDVAKVPLSALTELDSPQVQEANQRVDAYRLEHCTPGE